MNQSKAQRNIFICQAYVYGVKLRQLADKFNLSHEGIRQILIKNNIKLGPTGYQDIPIPNYLTPIKSFSQHIPVALWHKILKKHSIVVHYFNLVPCVMTLNLKKIQQLYPDFNRPKCKSCGNRLVKTMSILNYCKMCYRKKKYWEIPDLNDQHKSYRKKWYEKLKKDPIRYTMHCARQKAYHQKWLEKQKLHV